MREATDGSPTAQPLTPRLLGLEVVIVVAVALLGPALRALQVLAEYLATGDRVALHSVEIPGHHGLDAALQAMALIGACVPVALVAYMLLRSGESLRDLGLRLVPRLGDIGLALGLVAGMFGLALLAGVVSRSLGLHSLQLSTGPGLGPTYIPTVVIAALRAGLLEEVVVCGYMLHRLSQLGWSERRALVASVAVRASYHVYGGIPLVLFTILMGIVFARSYQKRRNLTALVLAHFTWDAVLFVLAIATR